MAKLRRYSPTLGNEPASARLIKRERRVGDAALWATQMRNLGREESRQLGDRAVERSDYGDARH